MNRVRFTGRIGRRTLDPGTYAVTAYSAGRAEPSGRIVVVILPRRGSLARQTLDCSGTDAPDGSVFGGIAGYFGDGQGAAANGSEASGSKEKQVANGKGSHGVLPAITRKIRNIPKAIPQPPFPGEADTPPMLLGLAALALLAFSAIAILAYVIRFLRRPQAST